MTLRKKYLALFFLLLLFLSSRVILLENINVGTESTNSEEASRVGVIGYQWLRGKPGHYLGLIEGSNAHHQLGITVKGALAGLFFWLLGISWQSMLLPVVMEGAILLIIIFAFLNEYFNFKVALLGGIFYTFSFPTWIMSTTSQAATSLLGVLASFSIIYIFCKIHLKGDKSNLTLGIFGFFIGISLFFELFWSLLTIIGLLIYFVIYLIRDKTPKFHISSIAIFSLSLIIGLIPFSLYHLQVQNSFIYHGENVATYSTKIFQNSLKELKDFSDYFISSFGFHKISLIENTKLVGLNNFIFFSLAIIIFIYLIDDSIIKTLTKGEKFTQKRTKIFLITMILISLNILAIVSSPRAEPWDKFLHHKYRYLTYIHFLFILIVPCFYFRVDKKKKKLGSILLVFLIVSGILSFFGLALERSNFVYNPVRGEWYKKINMERRPPLYKMPYELFTGYFSFTQNAKYSPSIPRKMSSLKGECGNFKNKTLCYRLTGAYFADIRRYDISRAFTLCKRLNPKYFEECKDGISWAVGFYSSYNSSWNLCNSTNLNIDYNECEKGRKAGREALQYESLRDVNFTVDSANKLKKAITDYKNL